MLDSLKREYRIAPTYKRLLYINIAIFVVFGVIGGLVTLLTNSEAIPRFVQNYFWSHSEPQILIKRFWTPFTYMFFHAGFGHILFNMLVLYIGGRVFNDVIGDKRVLNNYILGGLVGFVICVIAINGLEYADHSPIVGASAAITSIVVCSAVFAPNYVINLLLLGPIKWKYVASILVILSFMKLSGPNRFGELSHIGGALWGFLYASQLKKGNDIGAWFDRILNNFSNLFKPKSKIRVEYSSKNKVPRNDHTYNEQKKANQEKIDQILDKISKSGYDSLSSSEKEILFKASGKNE